MATSPTSGAARRLMIVVICALLGATAAAAGRHVQRVHASAASAAVPTGARPGPVLDATDRKKIAQWMRTASGDRTVVLFIGAEFCGASKVPGFVPAVSAVLDTVRMRTQRDSALHISTVGVSLDPKSDVGVKYLATHGRFDQISAGENWLNDAAVRYIWRDIRGAPGLPQVVVIRRRLNYTQQGIEVGPDSLLFRKVGNEAIITWAQSGVPLQ